MGPVSKEESQTERSGAGREITSLRPRDPRARPPASLYGPNDLRTWRCSHGPQTETESRDVLDPIIAHTQNKQSLHTEKPRLQWVESPGLDVTCA